MRPHGAAQATRRQVVADVGEAEAGGNTSGAQQRDEERRLAHAVAVPHLEDVAGAIGVEDVEVVRLVRQVAHEVEGGDRHRVRSRVGRDQAHRAGRRHHRHGSPRRTRRRRDPRSPRTHARPTPRVTAAADRLARGDRVTDAAAAVAASPRHLRRLFEDHVGLGPKSFQTVARFRRFLHVVRAAPAAGRPAEDETQAHHAAACGYSDEAHLAHDCAPAGRYDAAVAAQALLTARLGTGDRPPSVPDARRRRRAGSRAVSPARRPRAGPSTCRRTHGRWRRPATTWGRQAPGRSRAARNVRRGRPSMATR